MNILHVSDMHFTVDGADKDIRDGVFRKLRESFTEIVTNNENLMPDLILISGDIAFHGKMAEYELAISEIREWVSIFNLDMSRVVVCPGNHDIMKDKTERITTIENNLDANKYLTLPKLAKNSEYFSDFQNFCKSLGLLPLTLNNNEEHSCQYLFGVHNIKVNDINVAIAVHNTAWNCLQDNTDNKNIWVSAYTTTNISEKLNSQKENNIVISLMHHSYSHLNENEQHPYGGNESAISCIYEYSDLVLCGHVHADNFQVLPRQNKSCEIISMELYDSPLYPNGKAKEYEQHFGCQLIQISDNISDFSVYGLIYRANSQGSCKWQLLPVNDIDKCVQLQKRAKHVEKSNTNIPDLMVTGIEESKKIFEYATEKNAVINDIILQKNNDCNIDVALIVQLNEKKKETLPSLRELFVTSNQEKENPLLKKLRETSNVLFVLGNGGTGKTYSLMKVWHSLYTEPELYGEWCAIFIQIHNLDNSKQPVQKYIKEYLFNNDEKKYTDFKRFWFAIRNNDRPLILILDGLNEVSSDMQGYVYEDINELSQKLNIFIIVTSRYADNLRLSIRNAIRSDIEELDYRKQIIPYLKKLNEKNLANVDISSLSKEDNKLLRTLIKTPLMLSLYAQTSLYYTAMNEDEQTVLKCRNSVLFYGPVFSESTIIYNYLQGQIKKYFDDDGKKKKEKLLAFASINLIVPHIAYNMQKKGDDKEDKKESVGDMFTISLNDLRKYAKDAIIYSEAVLNSDKFKRFEISRGEYVEGYSPIKIDINELLDFLITKLSIFCRVSLVKVGNLEDNHFDNDSSSKFSLSHQHLRDCMAAIHLINSIEITLNKNNELCEMPKHWQSDDITNNRHMVRHIAYLEDRNNRTKINALWKFVSDKSSENRAVSNIDSIYNNCDKLINNMLSVYNYILKGNLSELNFDNLNLKSIRLGTFDFQPVKNANAFKNTTFGVVTFPLGGHWDTVHDIDISDDRMLSRGESTLRLWNTNTKNCIDIVDTFDEDSTLNDVIFNACFHPNCKEIVAYFKGSSIIEKRVEGNPYSAQYHLKNSKVISVCYSKDGKYIIAQDLTFKIYVWKISEDKTDYYVDDCCYTVDSICTTNATDTLIGLCDEKCFRIVDFTKQPSQQKMYWELNDEKIVCSKFSPDGTILAVAFDTIVRFWKIGETSHFKASKKFKNITNIKFNKGGDLLAVFTISDANIILIEKGNILETIDYADSIAFFENKESLENKETDTIDFSYVIGLGGDISSRSQYKGVRYTNTSFDGHRPCVNDMSVRYDYKRCVVAYDDGTIREWSIVQDEDNNGKFSAVLLHTYTNVSECYTCVVYSSDGEFFIVGTNKGNIQIWDSDTKSIIHKFNAHNGSVCDLKLTSNNKLISCGHDEYIKAWDLDSKTLICIFPKLHGNAIECIEYYSDKKNERLISGSNDGKVILWDIAKINAPIEIPITQKHKTGEHVRSLSVCPKKKTFISHAQFGDIFEFDIISGALTGREIVFGDSYSDKGAYGLSYSPDGNKVLVAIHSGIARTNSISARIEEWGLDNNAACLKSIVAHDGDIENVYYYVDSHKIISSSLDGSFAISNLDTQNVELKVTPVSAFNEKLHGYEIDNNVTFIPSWIKKYYTGSNEILNIDIDDGMQEYFNFFSKGIKVNIFDHIKKYENVEIPVTIFMMHTQDLSLNNDDRFLIQELNFLLANVYYLWLEAPPNEQNFEMLKELFFAFETRAGQADYESDLDRLFNMLEEKNSKHIAVKYYNAFKRYSQKNAIVSSCLQRIYPFVFDLPINFYDEKISIDNVCVEEFSKEFVDNLRNGIILNPFTYIEKCVYSCEDEGLFYRFERDDIKKAITAIILHTNPIFSDDSFRFTIREMAFLLSMSYYLWFEAPKDEQNMFMIAELCRAFKIREGQEDYESDIDRLFEMLEEKDPRHIALQHYKIFKKSTLTLQDSVVKSCYFRIFPIMAEDDTYHFPLEKNTINKFVDSFIANTNCQEEAGVEVDLMDAERELVFTMISSVNKKFNIEDKNDRFTNNCFEFLKSTNGNYEIIKNNIDVKKFTALDIKTKKHVIYSILCRLRFFVVCYSKSEKIIDEHAEYLKALKEEIEKL